MVNDQDITVAVADNNNSNNNNNNVGDSDDNCNKNKNNLKNENLSSIVCVDNLSHDNGTATNHDSSQIHYHPNNVTTVDTTTSTATNKITPTDDNDLTSDSTIVQSSNNNETQQNGGGQDDFIRITGAHQTLIEAQQHERDKNYPLALHVYRICVDLLLEELIFTEGTDKSRIFLREKCNAIMDKVDDLKKLLDPIEIELGQPLPLEHELEQPLALEHELEQPLALEHEHTHEKEQEIVDHLQTMNFNQKQENDQQ
ncbi:unnamed protein product [Didymodactylos carnosus]|uniref:MIT domain-containing protein n=1 Tax=Didymodactylos carnosus TaxID=1234261 RepID=A0A813PBE7_9BILA|nr:unnamed protein product [Didymodactylos carnosus]CAF0746350.1 unnamed protein product [Didymodactylos carnosus]CAF3515999.1 unnamed protein product [Didymodactylos carnosus]CAF3525184.1 unnamed protein product [Didymodactylos carnosus]